MPTIKAKDNIWLVFLLKSRWKALLFHLSHERALSARQNHAVSGFRQRGNKHAWYQRMWYPFLFSFDTLFLFLFLFFFLKLDFTYFSTIFIKSILVIQLLIVQNYSLLHVVSTYKKKIPGLQYRFANRVHNPHSIHLINKSNVQTQPDT